MTQSHNGDKSEKGPQLESAPHAYDINYDEGRELDKLQEHQEQRIDYSHFDARFDNLPVTKGPQFTGVRAQQAHFAQQNARTWQPPSVAIPEVADLTPALTTRVPVTRHWYRRSSSMEKNGHLNIGTIRFFLRLKAWLFYPLIVWGVTSQAVNGLYQERFNVGDDDNRVYDKLAMRPLSSFRVWARPG